MYMPPRALGVNKHNPHINPTYTCHTCIPADSIHAPKHNLGLLHLNSLHFKTLTLLYYTDITLSNPFFLRGSP